MNGQVDSMKSNLRFLDYIVEEFKFDYNLNFEEIPIKIDFHVDNKIVYLDELTEDVVRANVHLTCCVFKDAVENNYPFSLTVRIMGMFELENLDPNSLKLVETNAIAILFPYARALITTITANANVTPLILPPININRMLESQVGRSQE